MPNNESNDKSKQRSDNRAKKLFNWIETFYWHVEKVSKIALSESISPWWATKLREALDTLQVANNLGWIGLILTTLLLPIGIYNIIRSVTSEKDKVVQGVTIAKMISSIALATIGALTAAGLIYIITPLLFTISAAKSLIENSILLSKHLYNRFFRKNTISKETTSDLTELTKLMNEKRKNDEAIVNSTHAILQSSVALTGSIFLFVFPPAGIIILLATAIYGLLDPIRRIGQFANFISRKIRNKPLFDPFRMRTEEEVYQEINQKISLPNKKNELSRTEKPTHGEKGHVHGSETTLYARFMYPGHREKLMGACKKLFENCKEKLPSQETKLTAVPNLPQLIENLEQRIRTAKEKHDNLTKGSAIHINDEASQLTLLIEDITDLFSHAKNISENDQINTLKTEAQALAESITKQISDKNKASETMSHNNIQQTKLRL
ncbi:MAG: hypothetical protein A3F42_03100 [Gammaproteobacteria bacterium RIFCSPHIGHO2_12_FULL_37_34]|nr:MAG: hypothetical protein A3F42_03100 [Gammaproteobacteria bacterium RIFCSPHIGHO2_12_FULL_37_34]